MKQVNLKELFIQKYIERFESTREMAEFALSEAGELHDERSIEWELRSLSKLFG